NFRLLRVRTAHPAFNGSYAAFFERHTCAQKPSRTCVLGGFDHKALDEATQRTATIAANRLLAAMATTPGHFRNGRRARRKSGEPNWNEHNIARVRRARGEAR